MIILAFMRDKHYEYYLSLSLLVKVSVFSDGICVETKFNILLMTSSSFLGFALKRSSLRYDFPSTEKLESKSLIIGSVIICDLLSSINLTEFLFSVA